MPLSAPSSRTVFNPFGMIRLYSSRASRRFTAGTLKNPSASRPIPAAAAARPRAIIRGMRCGLTVLVLAASTAGARAQPPQPFPRPGDPARPQPSSPAPAKPDAQGPKVLPPDPSPAAAQSAAAEPTEQTLGLPL